MCNLQNLRAIGLLLGAVVAALAVSVPKPVASHRGAYQPDNPQGWGQIIRDPADHRPMQVISRLFPNDDDCAAVKLDIALRSGLLTYTLLNNPDAGAPPANAMDEPGRTTMLIGGKNCRVRIVVEREDGRNGGN